MDNPKGLTIDNIAKKLSSNRTSPAKYLNTLLISGQAEMRTFGRAKVFTLSQRVPLFQLQMLTPCSLTLSSDLLLVLDQHLAIYQVNEPFIKLFGFSRSTCLFLLFATINPSLLRDRYRRLRVELLKTIDGNHSLYSSFSCHSKPCIFINTKKI